MTGIEAAAGRTAAAVGSKLFGAARRHVQAKQVRDSSRAAAARRVADDFVASLDGARAESLSRYLASPDFEEVALQLALWRLLRDHEAEEIEPTLREEIRLGLHHAVGLDPEQLTVGADVVLAALQAAVLDQVRGLGTGDVDRVVAAGVAHLASAAVANSRLLGRVGSLAEFHAFGERLRAQVVQLHGRMRMPHLGISRSVPYSRLYVEPSLDGLADLAAPGRRSVVLGDPGAGKSTLAAKLAWEVAREEGGRVPFPVVLREFTESFRSGGRGLVSYLKALCQAPYNLVAPDDAIEYLLGNGRAVVILDGVDELVEPELRRRFARLVESFTHLYPLVPVVVTARRIGYDEAPLDPVLFTVGAVEQFDDERVERYARLWFSLEESTREDQRAGLAEAFLRESKSVGELRRNPLLLALLCTMFAYEHYIPTNLAQVYEKCALMLFEQWDRSRGIRDPLRFQGRLRSAVGYLAWRQFTAPESGVGWPRGRVVRMLSDFLQRTKGYRTDEAEEEAEQFVEFCSGRPWVLTDVGGGAVEPKYGFAHRTFMEFFAAEHLVRTRTTPEALWEALEPDAREPVSDVIRQLALQQFDRNQEDGASAVLRLAAEGDGRALLMAANALHYLTPTPDVLRLLADRMVRNATSWSASSQFFYWSNDERLDKAVDRNLPLTIAWAGLPSNQPALRETAIAALRDLIRRGDHSAHLTWLRLELDRAEVAEWADSHIAAALVDPDADVNDAIRRFGARVIYLWDGTTASLLLRSRSPLDPRTLIEAECPWIPARKWWDELPDRVDTWDVTARVDDHPLRCLVRLPIVETFERHPERFDQIRESVPPMLWKLVEGRRDDGGRQDALVNLRKLGVSGEVLDFLDRWMRGEFDVIG